MFDATRNLFSCPLLDENNTTRRSVCMSFGVNFVCKTIIQFCPYEIHWIWKQTYIIHDTGKQITHRNKNEILYCLFFFSLSVNVTSFKHFIHNKIQIFKKTRTWENVSNINPIGTLYSIELFLFVYNSPAIEFSLFPN